MNLTASQNLWWLLVLPVLVWLSLPPRPRRVLWTAYLPLVERAMAARRVRPPRRSNTRLLLLLAAATAVVFAHAGLGVPAVPGPQRLVVLLDASASMAAHDGDAAGSSRWQAARRRLQQQLRAVPDHVDVTLLRCGGQAVRRHGAFARELADLGEPGGAARADLAALVAALPDDTAVSVVTDGQGGAPLPARGGLLMVGEAADNAAVLDVQLRDDWPLPGLGVEVDVVAFTAAPVAVQIEVQGEAVEPLRSTVTLQPALPQRVTFSPTRRAAGGPLRVVVRAPGDVLAEDDTWSCRLPPLPAPKVAVLADPEAGPYANVAAATLAAEVGGEVVAPAQGSAGLLLVDGGEVALAAGEQRALCFGTRLTGQEAAPVWIEPRVTDWDRRLPLTAGLDLSGLRIAVALPETLPEGEPFLFGSDPQGRRAPLAVFAGREEVGSVHFAFRLADSNLPLLPAFPQLLRRAFVRTHGTAAAATEVRAPLAEGEQDLRRRAGFAERQLPPFGCPRRSLGPVCLWGALLLLVVRALLR